MIITLCSSAKFFERLGSIASSLENLGYEILLPSMVDYHHLEETALVKIQHNLMRNHFNKINKSHAIYVANYEKNGIEGYIGGSVFLEMGKAFDKNIPIFLKEQISQKSSYKEELMAMQPIIVGENWNELDRILKGY